MIVSAVLPLMFLAYHIFTRSVLFFGITAEMTGKNVLPAVSETDCVSFDAVSWRHITTSTLPDDTLSVSAMLVKGPALELLAELTSVIAACASFGSANPSAKKARQTNTNTVLAKAGMRS